MGERHRVSLRGGRAEEANSACGDLRRNLGRAGRGFDQAGAESLASCLDLQPSAESTRSARTMQSGRAASLGNRKQLFGGEVSGLSVRALLFAGLEGLSRRVLSTLCPGWTALATVCPGHAAALLGGVSDCLSFRHGIYSSRPKDLRADSPKVKPLRRPPLK